MKKIFATITTFFSHLFINAEAFVEAHLKPVETFLTVVETVVNNPLTKFAVELANSPLANEVQTALSKYLEDAIDILQIKIDTTNPNKIDAFIEFVRQLPDDAKQELYSQLSAVLVKLKVAGVSSQTLSEIESAIQPTTTPPSTN